MLSGDHVIFIYQSTVSALGLRVQNLQKDVPLCIAEMKSLGVRNCNELETLQKFGPKQ